MEDSFDYTKYHYHCFFIEDGWEKFIDKGDIKIDFFYTYHNSNVDEKFSMSLFLLYFPVNQFDFFFHNTSFSLQMTSSHSLHSFVHHETL